MSKHGRAAARKKWTGEHGMMFSAFSVRAIAAGAKTVTRRVVMVPEDEPTLRGGWEPSTMGGPLMRTSRGETVKEFPVLSNQTTGKTLSAPWATGDTLWIRERWKTHERPSDSVDGILFEADGAFVPIENSVRASEAWVDSHDNGKYGEAWRPAMFMPRWARRTKLEVVSVRVERLHAIDDADAIREGVRSGVIPADEHAPQRIGYVLGDDDGKCTLYPSERAAFAVGWDELNGERAPWSANPYVWRVEFRRL